jgi:hypothetical protein
VIDYDIRHDAGGFLGFGYIFLELYFMNFLPRAQFICTHQITSDRQSSPDRSSSDNCNCGSQMIHVPRNITRKKTVTLEVPTVKRVVGDEASSLGELAPLYCPECDLKIEDVCMEHSTTKRVKEVFIRE